MPALGSEQPGPQHSFSRKCGRPAVHPEAVWELTPQLAPVAWSLHSSPEASGGSPQISTSRSRCLLWDLNSLGHSTRSPGSAGDLVCTRRQSESSKHSLLLWHRA